MPLSITPAPQPEEWARRRSGTISIDRIADEVHVVVHDPDDQLVSVSGPDELFAHIALANHALPDDDARKITTGLAFNLRVAAEAVRQGHFGGLASRLEHGATVLEALLPPCDDRGLPRPLRNAGQIHRLLRADRSGPHSSRLQTTTPRATYIF
jgi:hypothetical protein